MNTAKCLTTYVVYLTTYVMCLTIYVVYLTTYVVCLTIGEVSHNLQSVPNNFWYMSNSLKSVSNNPMFLTTCGTCLTYGILDICGKCHNERKCHNSGRIEGKNLMLKMVKREIE